jgi:hypothetical protein
MSKGMKETLINLATSQLAREKGCNLEYCTCGGFPECICGDDLYLLPQSLLAKWLREVHNIDIVINYDHGYSMDRKYYSYRIRRLDSDKFIQETFGETYDTYEQVFESALFDGLKLIKDENTR